MYMTLFRLVFSQPPLGRKGGEYELWWQAAKENISPKLSYTYINIGTSLSGQPRTRSTHIQYKFARLWRDDNHFLLYQQNQVISLQGETTLKEKGASV